MKRRDLFKKMLGFSLVAGSLGKVVNGMIRESLAQNPAKGKGSTKSAGGCDAKIVEKKTQGYISAGGTPLDKDLVKYKKHNEKVAKVKTGTKAACWNCKHYKPAKDMKDCGKCTMVQATAKPGKYVSKNGWCRVWQFDKKKIS